MPLAAIMIVGALALNGCFLAPAIDSFNKLGVTESDRQALLAERLKNFSDALYWGQPGEALAFVAAQSRAELEPELRRIQKQEKIVESKIEGVGFSESGYKAKVDVVVRYFRVPFYVVNERAETQNWEFGLSGGWQLVSREQRAQG